MALAAVAPFRPSSARKKIVSSTKMPPAKTRKTSHKVLMIEFEDPSTLMNQPSFNLAAGSQSLTGQDLRDFLNRVRSLMAPARSAVPDERSSGMMWSPVGVKNTLACFRRLRLLHIGP